MPKSIHNPSQIRKEISIIDKFHIALSFAHEDRLLAEDLFAFLTEIGYNVFCSTISPNIAKNQKGLSTIYKNSLINVILWSKHYANCAPDRTAAVERSILESRHRNPATVGLLYILVVDDTSVIGFPDVLPQRLSELGIYGSRNGISEHFVSAVDHISLSRGEVCHPPTTHLKRKIPVPFRFMIDPNYRTDKPSRWRKLADIAVYPLGNTGFSPKLIVYLIPSGNAPPYLSHPTSLRIFPERLEEKRQISEEFIKKNLGRELTGMIFGLIDERNVDDLLPHAYCEDYDICLRTRGRSAGFTELI